jgi:hypothetical protein
VTATDYAGTFVASRWVFQRGLAAIYFVAFLSAWNQFPALLGERGLLPVPRFVAEVPFRSAPSLFHAHYSDRFFRAMAATGLLLSLAVCFGLTDEAPPWASIAVWLALWAVYLSILNVGQEFYGFGWESMLVEAGFFAAFLGPARQAPSLVVVFLLRWMLFRVEFGAGLIKLRHDECWRNLTCLFYHHETQPLPNPLSFHAHRLPKPVLRAGVVFSHFVQLVVPFGLFAPRPFAAISAALAILHQLMLIVSGNYSWLNWLTIVLGVTALDDAVLSPLLPLSLPAPAAAGMPYDALVYVLLATTLVLSVKPALNFFSSDQFMNHSYNPLHLVNAYGAFGSVTRERFEIVLEGTAGMGKEGNEWREFEFKAKPGCPRRRPPQIAPYHLRLDWMMWFLPFSATLVENRLFLPRVPEIWFLRLIEKLLEHDRPTLKLLRSTPFPSAPPARIRAAFYRYEFTTQAERKATGDWWRRERIGEFFPPVSLSDLRPRPTGAGRRNGDAN